MKITIEADLPHEANVGKQVLEGVTTYLLAYSTGGAILRPGNLPMVFPQMLTRGVDPRAIRHGLLDIELSLSGAAGMAASQKLV